VIDGGSYVGMSVLRTKALHPHARVTAFEPEPSIRALLERNLAANGLTDVEVVPKGLGPEDGTVRFAPDGADGGHIDESGATEIATTRPSGYLDERVHFLKLDIEGQELPVLREAAGKVSDETQWFALVHGSRR
jgi:FkbM family methyltransferase